MASSFSEKNSRIVIVDSSTPVRQMMTEVLRSLSYPTVEGKASIADIIEYLEIEPVGWIIAPLMPDQDVNALHLLKIISQIPHLKGTRVSFLLEEDERYVLPEAFELGLLSWHSKPFTKESLKEALNDLEVRLRASDWNETLVAAGYLRAELSAQKKVAALLQLEKSLVDNYPGNTVCMLDLARAQHANGMSAPARATLGQVKLLAPDQSSAVDEVALALFETSDLSSSENTGINALGLRNVVIVDSDETVTREIENILKHVGVETIKCFQDGVEAWEYLNQAEEPDLIIQEWRLPKLTGPYFVQKIRHKGFTSVPIMLVSSLLKPADMPLLREMGIAQIINKPLAKEEFMSGLVWTIQQDRSPSEQQTLEAKIRSLLSRRKINEALALKKRFFASDQVVASRRHLIEAEFAFVDKDYKKARDNAIEAMKSSGDSIIALNLLGKTFMQLGEFESALKCFQKAQNLSPRNVERLCTIAEVHTELGNKNEATDAMKTAEELDAGSDQVNEAKVKIALAKGDTATATRAMSELDSLSPLLGYMNNKAVALARCGQTEEAILLYENTCTSIPPDKPDLISIVKYNLALALVRADDLEKAGQVLDEVKALKKSRIHHKAASLSIRVKKALKTGESLHLKGAPNDAAVERSQAESSASVEPVDENLESIVAGIEAEPGDLCCFKLFHNTEEPEPRTTSLLSNTPRFRRRETISREEGLGAEKTMKVS